MDRTLLAQDDEHVAWRLASAQTPTGAAAVTPRAPTMADTIDDDDAPPDDAAPYAIVEYVMGKPKAHWLKLIWNHTKKDDIREDLLRQLGEYADIGVRQPEESADTGESHAC